MFGYGSEEGVVTARKPHGAERMDLQGLASDIFIRKGTRGQSKRGTKHDGAMHIHNRACHHTPLGSSVQSRLQNPELGC